MTEPRTIYSSQTAEFRTTATALEAVGHDGSVHRIPLDEIEDVRVIMDHNPNTITLPGVHNLWTGGGDVKYLTQITRRGQEKPDVLSSVVPYRWYRRQFGPESAAYSKAVRQFVGALSQRANPPPIRSGGHKFNAIILTIVAIFLAVFGLALPFIIKRNNMGPAAAFGVVMILIALLAAWGARRSWPRTGNSVQSYLPPA